MHSPNRGDLLAMQRKITLHDIILTAFFLIFDFGIIISACQLGTSEERLFIQRILIIASSVPLILDYVLAQTFSLRECLCVIFFLILSVVTFIATQSFNVLKLSLFILAARGTTLRKAVIFNIGALFLSTCIIVLTSIFGITDIYFRESAVKFDMIWTTYVFGFNNPNTPPLIIFSIITGYNIINRHNIKSTIIFSELFIGFMIFFFFASRTALFAITGYCILLLGYKLFSSNRIFKWIMKPLQYTFLFFTILSLAAIYYYSDVNTGWRELNLLLSNRLYLWKEFFNLYGFSFLGQNMSANDAPLDNGYVFILIYYGTLVLAIYNIMFLYVSRFCYRKCEWVLLITAITYSVYGFFETGILSFGFCNVLLVFSVLVMNGKKSKNLLI